MKKVTTKNIIVTPKMAAMLLELNARRNMEIPVFKEVPITSIHTAAPFKDFMPFDVNTVSVIADSMREYGYDMAYPIVIWKDHEGIIIDGHLRFAAAQKAGLKKVIIAEKAFADEKAALEYIFHKNLLRSSYTDAQLLEFYEKGMMTVISGVKKRLLKRARKTMEVR